MKTNTKNEEAVLLKAVNGDKKGPNDQVTIVVDEQSQFTLNFYATIFVVTAFLKLPSNAFILWRFNSTAKAVKVENCLYCG